MDYSLELLHDAEITEVNSRKDRSILELIAVTSKNGRILIELSGCSVFRISDFTYQNVIYRVVKINRNRELIKEKILWATEIGGASSFLDSQKVDSILDRVELNELSVFYFEPSWGAEIVALSKSIIIRPLST